MNWTRTSVMAMSDSPLPTHTLEQADVVDLHPRENGGTGECVTCGEEKRVHVCHGPNHRCSDCCKDASAGTGECQRFIARERAGTLLVNRRHIPAGWGNPEQWPVDREVVDIGRADHGNAVITNTEPGDPGWLGNPYRLEGSGGEHTREESVYRFRSLFYRLADENPEFRERVLDLQGKVLMGWCTPKLCHGDVLLEWLDAHADG